MASSFNIAGAGRIQFSNNRHVIAFPRREYARVLPYIVLPAKNQRAQGMPGARCARSLACKVKKHTSIVTTVTPDSPGIPHAMVLTVSFVLSPVIGLYCHRRVSRSLPASLTPASRRQDHTTSPSASAPFVEGANHVHRISPRVRDDRDTPLSGTRRRD
jgi:hypothetical protein